MVDIVIASSPVYGHFAPMRTIAADLVQRGNRVTVLTGAAFREATEATGAAFAGLSGAADLDFAAITRSPQRPPAGPRQLEYDLRNLFVSPIPEQHKALQDLLAKSGGEPTVVLWETTFWGVAPLMLGAPGLRPAAMVGVGVIPFTLASADTAPFGLGLPPDSSKEGRARNREMYEFMQGEVLAPAQALYTELLTGLGVTETPPFFLDATILKADRFLQLAIEELSYKRTDTPEHVRFVGTLAGVRPEGIALPGWWPDVQAADAVVVVTQGTVANKDFADLIEPTLEALADLPVLTVAATGRSGAVRKVPSNARVAEFIPFDVLLPHADVLVTNGGFGAVQQALRNGTPLVVAGTTEDKREGNARTAATGAAINLAVDRPEPAQIRTAVQTVLAEPGYLKHAERLAAEYAATDALGAIARTVEELGR